MILAAALGAGLGDGVIGAAAHTSKKHKACHRKHHRGKCKRRREHHHHTTTGPSSTNPGTTTPTTTNPTGLASRLEVDENDTPSYSLAPSHNPVAAGKLTFNVYNFGQDDHTFAVLDSAQHELAYAAVPAGQSQTAVTVNASLPAGTYTLECTLPGHAALGMKATLTVQ